MLHGSDYLTSTSTQGHGYDTMDDTIRDNFNRCTLGINEFRNTAASVTVPSPPPEQDFKKAKV